MRSNCTYRFGTSLFHDICSLCNGAGSINHIVYDDDILILDITDYLNRLNDIGFKTCLIAKD